MAARDAKRPHRFDLAIVGTPALTHELRGALAERRFPYGEVRLLSGAEGETQITEFDGEPRVVSRADPKALAGVDLAFFCEDPATGGEFRHWPGSGGFLAIDLTEDPAAPEDLPLAHAGLPSLPLTPSRGWLAAAHPISHLLVSLLAPIDARVRLGAVQGVVLRPAADFGQPGIDELYQQSVKLFNFSSLPNEVFARQLAFNVIPDGAAARGHGLAGFLSRQVAALLGRSGTRVDLFLAVAPVFHAHTVALHLEFDGRPTEPALRELLRASGDVRVGAEPLTAVEVADERRPHVGIVRPDADGRGAWMWAVADKVAAAAADGAVRLAERMLGVEPRPPLRGRGTKAPERVA